MAKFFTLKHFTFKVVGPKLSLMFATSPEIVYILCLPCDQDGPTKKLFAIVRISRVLA